MCFLRVNVCRPCHAADPTHIFTGSRKWKRFLMLFKSIKARIPGAFTQSVWAVQHVPGLSEPTHIMPTPLLSYSLHSFLPLFLLSLSFLLHLPPSCARLVVTYWHVSVSRNKVTSQRESQQSRNESTLHLKWEEWRQIKINSRLWEKNAWTFCQTF